MGPCRALATYPMIFDQSRQEEDLMTYLLAEFSEDEQDEIVSGLQLDLS
jgi:hypothetical protein